MSDSFIVIDKKISFKEFYHLAVQYGSGISDITNIKDIILISKDTSLDQIAYFIGAILFGRIPIIIPPPSNKVHENEFNDKMNKIKQVTNPILCISDKKHNLLYSNFFNTIDSININNIYKPISINYNEIAFMQLSSGTTGLPKIFEVTHKAVIEQCDEYAAQINILQEDVIVSWLPLYHDMGLIACFMMPLLNNISFIHINPFAWLNNPNILLQYIEKYNGTHCWMPNFAFSFMANRCKNTYNLSSMKKWISCSEIAHYQDLEKFSNKLNITKKSLNICYAMAENIFAVSHSNTLKQYNDIISCGELTPGTSVIIKDDNDKLITSTGETGKIFIRSSYLANNLQLDEFGYYYTGDYGFIIDNELYIKGRYDDMIISYGKNIYPYDMENTISQIKGVIPGRVACFGVYNKIMGTQKIHIIAEVNNVNDTNIKQKIASIILKTFDINIKCIIVNRGYIIKTSSGKINRKKTKQKFLKG